MVSLLAKLKKKEKCKRKITVFPCRKKKLMERDNNKKIFFFFFSSLALDLLQQKKPQKGILLLDISATLGKSKSQY